MFGLLNSSVHLRKQYKELLLDSVTEEHINTYKEKCSILRKLKRRGKGMYYVIKFKEYSKQSKKWQLMNIPTNHSRNKKHIIGQVNVNDISYFNPKDIANQFLQYFSTIGNNLSSYIQ